MYYGLKMAERTSVENGHELAVQIRDLLSQLEKDLAVADPVTS